MSGDHLPVVLLLGCAEVAPLLECRGLRGIAFDAMEELLCRGREVQARACLVRAGALGNRTVRQVIADVRKELPFTELLLWMPRARAGVVREALTSGARDVVLCGADTGAADALAEAVERQELLPHLGRDEGRSQDTWIFEGMVSRSRKMWDLFDTCTRTAATGATVLVLGETGTGKELLARAVHRRSGRQGRFVALNCGAVPEALIDSELFGHQRGAFSGASREKQGLFRRADGGTLLLDEIGAVPVAVQYRLLRALQEERVRPVGSDTEVAVDVRVIAATSRSLDDAVVAGTFREDLLYRLDVIRLIIPPLRDRPEDILLLFDYFSRKMVEQYRLVRPELGEDFVDALLAYDWPGNVRQLENYTERLLLTHAGGKLRASHFQQLTLPLDGESAAAATVASGPGPGDVDDGGALGAGERRRGDGHDRDARRPRSPRASAGSATPARPPAREPDLSRPLPEVVREHVDDLERAYLEACLRRHGGRVGETARHAGINRRTLLRKMNQHGLDRRAFREPLPTGDGGT